MGALTAPHLPTHLCPTTPSSSSSSTQPSITCTFGTYRDMCGRERCRAGPGQWCGGGDNNQRSRNKCAEGLMFILSGVYRLRSEPSRWQLRALPMLEPHAGLACLLDLVGIPMLRNSVPIFK